MMFQAETKMLFQNGTISTVLGTQRQAENVLIKKLRHETGLKRMFCSILKRNRRKTN